MKRTHDVKVYYTKEELDLLKKRSEAVGLTISSYIRSLSLGVKIILE